MNRSNLKAEYARLLRRIEADDPDRQPLTRDESAMLRRWIDNDFPEDKTHLTPKETRLLTTAWAKIDKASDRGTT